MKNAGRRYIEGKDMEQSSLEAWSAEDEIGEDNPVRFLKVFAETLDLEELGFQRAKPAETGRPGYDPRTLLELYLYGHMNRIRSSRMLERESRRNIELWWLLGKLTPDHNTIADFRKENRKALAGVFREFIAVCMELKLVQGDQVCVDGTPIKANNGLNRSTSIAFSEKKLQYAREQLALVEKYLEGLDEADKMEQGRLNKPFALDLDPKNLPKPEEIKARIARHEEELRQMKELGERQILYTDPDARVMKTKDGGRRACYNVQTAVESGSHLVVGFEVTHDANDLNKLCSTAIAAKETMGLKQVKVIADKGYESPKDIEKCLLQGIVPDVGFIYDREQRVFNLEYIPQEITEERKASREPGDIQTCLHAGVLPECYENTNISIELQPRGKLSCFLRHEDGTVTCPMGKEMYPQAEKKYGTRYGSREACRICPNRCTDGKSRKVVQFGPETRYVPVEMYGSAKYPVQEIPDLEQPEHYHAFGRVKKEEARVMIFIQRDLKKQKQRMGVSEHPFGTVKFWDGANHYLCRGFEKVTAETALMFLSYNIRRAISLAGGVQKLISAFQGRSLQKNENQG